MKKAPKIMKFGILFSMVIMIVVLPTTIKAQSNKEPVIYQNWKMIGESSTNYEVSARVIKCDPDSTAQLNIECVGAPAAHLFLSLTDTLIN